jgi:hypothetical protein
MPNGPVKQSLCGGGSPAADAVATSNFAAAIGLVQSMCAVESTVSVATSSFNATQNNGRDTMSHWYSGRFSGAYRRPYKSDTVGANVNVSIDIIVIQ